ncbi:class I SAM-dependent methyltransferase [Musicola paradisiaca]|uniref:Methyltransferase domain-containing protein n=1 Tax=Musicola paradisiaca (strain Ech703) TaxID=579405 RepID=C6C414_MUSP7|nr:class I SAM-dependent methyltransferase [Musicola paradisiaca]ACS87341.1 hypothetical protein Dd703_3583 [Musicola paradisiaca Ech703]
MFKLFRRSKEKTLIDKCRLCGADSTLVYKINVLTQYNVNYFECTGCGSLQTEKPYWLDEAYSIPGVHIDVGQAARIIQTWIQLVFLLETIGFNKTMDCIDYGGSSGLLTRLMRDSGFEYFTFDRYDGAKYANYFKIDQLSDKHPALISAFEVFEHLVEPQQSLEEIFATNADLIVFSTQFYEQQGKDWDYLAPDCGQHIFFYTETALADFCRQRGYALKRTQVLSLLVRIDSPYAEVIDKSDFCIPDNFFGSLVRRVGWGTEKTVQDFTYAKDRFVRELQANSPNRARN